MPNPIGGSDTYDRWKPDNMRDHLTITQLCKVVGRSHARIKQCERAGIIPRPVRVKVGELKVRLYSPDEVAKIKRHFDSVQSGPKVARKRNRRVVSRQP